MNDIEWNFLDLLPPDVASKILTCLDDPTDIVRASSVSRVWRDFVIANGICKRLCLKLFPQLSGIAHVVDTSNTEHESSDIGCSTSAELEQLKKEHRVFATLARGLTSCEVEECIADALSASSTDNYPEEGVHNTLGPQNRVGRRASYWSSSGQNNPEVPERLTYELISDFCVITEINVQPFQAFFQTNSPIYSAKAVRFRMGYKVLQDEDEVDFSKDDEGQSYTDKHFVWTYTSKEFPMVQENRIQNFKLPEPVLCIGGIIQIELLGRVQRQEMDGMFYICVAYVQVLGQTLSPAFSVNPVEPPGRFVLTFNPQAAFSGPKKNINDKLLEITENPGTMQRHIRGWEQILNMLRGTPWVELYDSEDEIEQLDPEEDMVEE